MEVRIGRYVIEVSARTVDGDFNRTDTMNVLGALCCMCYDARRNNEEHGFKGLARRCSETANSINEALERAGYFD